MYITHVASLRQQVWAQYRTITISSWIHATAASDFVAGCGRNVNSVGGNGGKFNLYLLFRSYIGAAPKSNFHHVCISVRDWEAVVFALKTDLLCCVILSCVNIALDFIWIE